MKSPECRSNYVGVHRECSGCECVCHEIQVELDRQIAENEAACLRDFDYID